MDGAIIQQGHGEDLRGHLFCPEGLFWKKAREMKKDETVSTHLVEILNVTLWSSGQSGLFNVIDVVASGWMGPQGSSGAAWLPFQWPWLCMSMWGRKTEWSGFAYFYCTGHSGWLLSIFVGLDCQHGRSLKTASAIYHSVTKISLKRPLSVTSKKLIEN